MKVTLVLTTTLNMHVVTCMKATSEVFDLDMAKSRFNDAITNSVLTSDDSSEIKGVLFKDGDLPVFKIREAFADAVPELIYDASSPIITVKIYYKSKVIRTFTLSVE